MAAHKRNTQQIPPVPKLTRQQALAVRMGQQGSIQDADYCEIFSMNRLEASPQLAELVMRGVLIHQGERRDARYPAGPAWETWWSAAREGFLSQRRVLAVIDPFHRSCTRVGLSKWEF